MATDSLPSDVLHALRLLRANPHYIADARRRAPVSNSVAGATLAILLGVPRQYAEKAVREALDVLDREAGQSSPADVITPIRESLLECFVHLSQHEITTDAGAERLARCLQLRLAARGWVLERLEREARP